MRSLPPDRWTLSRSRLPILLLALTLALPLLACRPSAKSDQSFDQIRKLVNGKSGSEVERILGKPDVRETVLGDQRWIWWNYTFLDGDQYAPEIRGQIVHLEIILKRPAQAPEGMAEWRALGPLAVSYSKPSQGL